MRQKPDIGPFFGQTGHSGQASIRYIHPLGGPGWLAQELRAGFDFKTTDNNLDFGGIQIFAATQEVDQFSLTYAATEIDDAGVTTLQNDLVYSPGGLTGANTDAAFALSGTSYAKAAYLYDTLSLTRATRLPYGASWIMRARAQWANGNLLPSEQLGAGVHYTINRFVDIAFDYGWQLDKLPGAAKRQSRANIAITISY